MSISKTNSYIALSIATLFVLLAFLAFTQINAQTPTQTQTPVLISAPAPTIQDGDLIRATGTQDIYIVKIANGKQFKRLIINPDIFESYGHLEWDNVQDVNQSVVDSYATSNLVRKDGEQAIYRIYPDGDGGSKAQVRLTAEQMRTAGIDQDSIYTINNNEFNLYTTLNPIITPEEYTTTTPQEPTRAPSSTIQDGDLIRAISTEDIYIVKIINNKQFKRLIINPDIFESYGHLEWENVQDVDQSVVNSFQTSNLVRKDGEQTIYRIYPSGDGGTKAQLNLNQEQLNQAGIDQDSIYTINTNEFNLYRTLAPITSPEEYTTPTAPTTTDPAEQTPPTQTQAPPSSAAPPSPIIISVITDNKVRAPKNFKTKKQTLTTLTVQWSEVSNASKGYEIQWCTGTCTPSSEWENTADIPNKNTKSYTIENLTLETTYKIRIKSIQSDTKESEYATITHTMIVPVPTGLSVTTGADDNSLSVSWNAVTGVAGYKLRACVEDCDQDTNWEEYTSSGATHTITGLEPGTSHQVQVQAVHNSIESDWSSSKTQTTSGTAPTVGVASISSVVAGNAQIAVNWTAVTNANGGYQIQYCKSSDSNCDAAGTGSVWSSITAGFSKRNKRSSCSVRSNQHIKSNNRACGFYGI